MSASVSRLIPRVGSFSQALVAFRAAQLQACLSQLHGVDSIEAAILRARTLLRLGDPEAARRALQREAPATSRDHGEVALLSAVAHARLGDEEWSSDSFRDAFVFGISSLDVALEAEVEYYKGVTAFAAGDLVECRAACERGLEVAFAPTVGAKSGGNVPLDHVVSRIEELLGVIAGAEGRYDIWLIHAKSALGILDRCAIPDVFQGAYALRNLTILVRDFDIAEDAALVAQRAPSFAWTPDICRVEFATLEALGWCAALRGNSVAALQHFRQADQSASTSAERIIIGVDRASVAREAGHRAMLIEEISHATNLARVFDWEGAAGDTRYALLVLAQAAAPIEVVSAREMLDRHTAIRNAIDSTSLARMEPGTRAEEAYTHGIVLRAEGRLAASAERLQAAFETWGAIGFEWRAARAALELTELEAGDIFRLAVRRELHQRPDSIFATRARLVA
jgi:tetratricopeptide (TPR) repeat protein